MRALRFRRALSVAVAVLVVHLAAAIPAAAAVISIDDATLEGQIVVRWSGLVSGGVTNTPPFSAANCVIGASSATCPEALVNGVLTPVFFDGTFVSDIEILHGNPNVNCFGQPGDCTDTFEAILFESTDGPASDVLVMKFDVGINPQTGQLDPALRRLRFVFRSGVDGGPALGTVQPGGLVLAAFFQGGIRLDELGSVVEGIPDTEGFYDGRTLDLNDGGANHPATLHILVASDVAEVPEPASLLLLGSGLAGLAARRRRRRARV